MKPWRGMLAVLFIDLAFASCARQAKEIRLDHPYDLRYEDFIARGESFGATLEARGVSCSYMHLADVLIRLCPDHGAGPGIQVASALCEGKLLGEAYQIKILGKDSPPDFSRMVIVAYPAKGASIRSLPGTRPRVHQIPAVGDRERTEALVVYLKAVNGEQLAAFIKDPARCIEVDKIKFD